MKSVNIKKYSKALYEAGTEATVFDNICVDLSSVLEKLNLNSDFLVFLNDRHVKFSDKENSLHEIFSDFISERTYNFLKVLIKDKKISYLKEILVNARDIQKAKQDIIEITLESAIKMKPESLKEIAEIVELKSSKKVLVNNIENSEIIGGFILTIDNDMIFDYSIMGKLNGMIEKIKKLK